MAHFAPMCNNGLVPHRDREIRFCRRHGPQSFFHTLPGQEWKPWISWPHRGPGLLPEDVCAGGKASPSPRKKSLCTGIARVYVTLARRFPFAATPAPRQLPAGSQTAAGMAALRRCLVLGNICSGSAGMKPKQRPPWERKHREYQQIRNP